MSVLMFSKILCIKNAHTIKKPSPFDMKTSLDRENCRCRDTIVCAQMQAWHSTTVYIQFFLSYLFRPVDL